MTKAEQKLYSFPKYAGWWRCEEGKKYPFQVAMIKGELMYQTISGWSSILGLAASGKKYTPCEPPQPRQ